MPFKQYSLDMPKLGASSDDEDVEITPELRDSLIRSTGRKVMSGFESVGNLIGLPGSMVEDTLGLVTTGDFDKYNPFDQLLSPFSSENRATGRGLLREWGLAGKQDTWGNWGAGLALDIASDPLTWWSGIGALTKTGKAMKSAGLMDNITAAASKKFPRKLVGDTLRPMGKTQSKLRLTGQDLLDVIDDPVRKADALNAFQRAGGDINELSQPLGSLTGFRSPFGSVNIGQAGGRAEKLAQGVDEVFNTLRFGKIPGTQYSPGAHLASLMDYRARGMSSERMQRAAQEMTRREEAGRATSREGVILNALKLHRAGLNSTDDGKLLRRVLEFGAPSDPVTKEVADSMREIQRKQLQEGLDLGFKTKGELSDVEGMGHTERHWGAEFTKSREKQAGTFSAEDTADVNRSANKKGFLGGTERVNDLYSDQDLHAIADAGINSKAPKDQTIKQIRDEIEKKYGQEVLPYFVTRAGDKLRMRRMDIKGANFNNKLATRLNKNRFGKAYKRSWDTSADDIVLRIDNNGGLLPIGNSGSTAARVRDMDKYGWSARDVVVHSVKTPKKGGGTRVTNIFYKPVLTDRYASLAAEVYDNPQFRQGIFTNHPLWDMAYSTLHHNQKVEATEALYDLVSDYALPAPLGHEPKRLLEGTAVKDILTEMGLSRKAAIKHLFKRRGLNPLAMSPDDYSQAVKEVLDARLPKDMVDEIREMSQAFRLPPPAKLAGKMMDSLTNLFKVGVLTWPARYVRDRMSGIMRNVERGWFHPRDEVDAYTLLRGGEVADAHTIPLVRDWLNARNLPVDAQHGSDALRVMYSQYGPGTHSISSDVSGMGEASTGALSDLTKGIVGLNKSTLGGSIAGVARDFVGASPETDLWPHHIRGFMDRESTSFGPAVAGDRVGRFTDDMNRLTPFLNKLRKGEDPFEAMKQINFAQADYDPKKFTPTERQLKRIFPFYTFLRSQAMYLTKELLTNPGGALGQSIRATKSLRDPAQMTPDYVAETVSVPLGGTSDGSKSYLTGLGLMHEDPLSFLGSGPKGAALELISRSNPLIKMFIEGATGQATHQKGPLGGRPLEDLDPTWGRIAANINDLATGERTARINEPELARKLEFLLASSPLARVGTTLRTATDPRKLEKPWKMLANLLTGVRVSDISPGAQEAILRERLEKVMKDEHAAKQFLKTYIPKDELARMKPQERRAALQLKALMDQLAENAKARKAAEQGKSQNKSKLRPMVAPKLALETL